MKTIFVNNYYYIRGGAERVFFDEIAFLKSFGHEVMTFSMHYKDNFYSEFSRFFASQIEYRNVSFVRKLLSGMEMIYSRKCRRRFSGLLDYFKPDLIHAHNIYGRLTSSIIDAAKEDKVPVVMTLHDYKLICPSYLMLCKGKVCEDCKYNNYKYCLLNMCHDNALIPSFLYTVESYFNFIFKKYEWIRFFICPSKFNMRKHIEFGMPEEKLVHLPYSVNTLKYLPDFKVGQHILFAGRIAKEKGLLTLIKAVENLDAILRIVGDGPMAAECKEYAKTNNISNVVFELMKNSIFLVVPSEWYENLPMVALEAFAYGKPVIGSNIGGIPEIVDENENGLLFSPGDYLELREKIKYLIDRPSLIQEMGRRAREKAEKEYNPELHYQRLMSLYQKAMK
jgi:glycosyltransferase involved in cell wall biosynthesis